MILAQVRRTIRDRDLLSRGDGVLVACSGGPDSAALLSVLCALSGELGIRLHAASVNHGLRPQAAADVEVAGAQAAALGVAFTALSVTVEAGPSVQAQARRARYACLLDLRQELGFSHVAVGHTRDDQAETVIMRLLRGAGLRGLAGIRPSRADGVVRPLIDCAREDVARFARSQGLVLALDPSNDDTRFGRVRIRNQVLPVLLREDERLHTHLSELADEAATIAAWLETKAVARLSELGGPAETISLSEDDLRAPWLTSLLRHWLEATVGVTPARAHLAQLRRGLVAPAEIWLARGCVVRSVGDGSLHLAPGAEGSDRA